MKGAIVVDRKDSVSSEEYSRVIEEAHAKEFHIITCNRATDLSKYRELIKQEVDFTKQRVIIYTTE